MRVTALLHDTPAMGAVCKTAVFEMGQTKMWIPDVISKILPDCKYNSEIAVGRKLLFMADGVFTSRKRVMKKWPTSLHTVLLCSCQKNRINDCTLNENYENYMYTPLVNIDRSLLSYVNTLITDPLKAKNSNYHFRI